MSTIRVFREEAVSNFKYYKGKHEPSSDIRAVPSGGALTLSGGIEQCSDVTALIGTKQELEGVTVQICDVRSKETPGLKNS